MDYYEMVIIAAAARLISDKGSKPISLEGSGSLLLAAVGVAALIIGFFGVYYFLEWRSKKRVGRGSGMATRKAKGFFWNYYHDWKKRREFHRVWNRKRGKPR